MNRHLPALGAAVSAGFKKGISGYVWMLKILIPVSFVTLLLDAGGWIGRLDFLLEPVMSVLGLPPMAALPLLVGLFTGIYGSVAAMMVLPFTPEQMTLMAVFLLISHNLIVESTVQGKSGINPFAAAAFRLAASCLTVFILARILEPSGAEAIRSSAGPAVAAAFPALLQEWAVKTAFMCLKIFVIIICLMIVMEIMKRFHVIGYILVGVRPLLRLMGLDRRVGMLWLTAGLFGIAYGAAVIVEEAKEIGLSGEDMTKLHLSIGINHAVIEDPALFLPLGIHAFWLWVPRWVMAVVVVHLLTLWFRFAPTRHHRPRPETNPS